MKKIISFLLAVMLSVPIMARMTAFAAAGDEPTLAVSSVQANRGEKVKVKISLANNPGIASLKMKVRFDSGLTLNSVTYNSAMGGRFQKPETYGSPVTLNWFNGEENTYGDKVYAVLNFTVAKKASVGMHAVTVTYDEDDVYNIDEDNIPFKTVSGGVNVVISVTGLALDQASATASTGDKTVTLTPVFTPSNATNKNVTWSSSDESVATVDGGVVTLLKKGEATITAKSDDGGFEASCALTVLCSHLDCEEIPAEASTCIKQGHAAYTVCKECGEIVSGSDELLPFAEHSYGDPAWIWNGYFDATAVFTCNNGDSQQRLKATIAFSVTKKPTVTEEGEFTYRAGVTFEGKTYTDIKTVVMPRLAILGDADGDGEATALDTTIVQRYATLVRVPYPEEQLMLGDVDGDDELTVLDATFIQRYATRVPVPYPIGEIVE